MRNMKIEALPEDVRKSFHFVYRVWQEGVDMPVASFHLKEDAELFVMASMKKGEHSGNFVHGNDAD